ncbi:UNKNOWN [Stylonychia lemnae]|uniref:Uncharacterized protein n=1 Tax=Stylonychia lemnae TaxID=5949 RepID=A0A078A5E9_STYLE|nr:UNKNOWN [Stylonychia lemnae]|eukprot:CDW77119.1 UNKNOWN [Stylonychia lemnae]
MFRNSQQKCYGFNPQQIIRYKNPTIGTPKIQTKTEIKPMPRLQLKCSFVQHLTQRSYCSQYSPLSSSIQKYKLVVNLVIDGCREQIITIVATVTYLLKLAKSVFLTNLIMKKNIQKSIFIIKGNITITKVLKQNVDESGLVNPVSYKKQSKEIMFSATSPI